MRALALASAILVGSVAASNAAPALSRPGCEHHPAMSTVDLEMAGYALRGSGLYMDGPNLFQIWAHPKDGWVGVVREPPGMFGITLICIVRRGHSNWTIFNEPEARPRPRGTAPPVAASPAFSLCRPTKELSIGRRNNGYVPRGSGPIREGPHTFHIWASSSKGYWAGYTQHPDAAPSGSLSCSTTIWGSSDWTNISEPEHGETPRPRPRGTTPP